MNPRDKCNFHQLQNEFFDQNVYRILENCENNFQEKKTFVYDIFFGRKCPKFEVKAPFITIILAGILYLKMKSNNFSAN